MRARGAGHWRRLRPRHWRRLRTWRGHGRLRARWRAHRRCRGTCRRGCRSGCGAAGSPCLFLRGGFPRRRLARGGPLLRRLAAGRLAARCAAGATAPGRSGGFARSSALLCRGFPLRGFLASKGGAGAPHGGGGGSFHLLQGRGRAGAAFPLSGFRHDRFSLVASPVTMDQTEAQQNISDRVKDTIFTAPAAPFGRAPAGFRSSAARPVWGLRWPSRRARPGARSGR